MLLKNHIVIQKTTGDTIPRNVLNCWEKHLVQTERKILNCSENSPHNNCSFRGGLGKTDFHTREKRGYLKVFQI